MCALDHVGYKNKVFSPVLSLWRLVLALRESQNAFTVGRFGTKTGPKWVRPKIDPAPLGLHKQAKLAGTPRLLLGGQGGGSSPLCDIPSGCCFFTGPWTVTHSSLRMLRRVAAFCRPLQPVLLLVSFPRLWSPVVGVPGLCWMWRDVPFARQRRPIVGVLRMCWLLGGRGRLTVFAIHAPLSTGRP